MATWYTRLSEDGADWKTHDPTVIGLQAAEFSASIISDGSLSGILLAESTVYIHIRVIDRDRNWVNAAEVKYAIYEETSPDLHATLVDQGVVDINEGHVWLNVTGKTSKSLGQDVYLILTDSDGVPGTIHTAFAGKVTLGEQVLDAQGVYDAHRLPSGAGIFEQQNDVGVLFSAGVDAIGEISGVLLTGLAAGTVVIAEQILEGGPSDKYFPTRYINNEEEEIMTVITSFLTIRRHQCH